MRHSREEVIERAVREFEALDRLVAGLAEEDWALKLARPETKDPWTVKDSLAHITFWKADVVRSIRGGRRPAEMRGMNETEENHWVYEQWRGKDPREVLAWHRQVHEEVLAALREAPETLFSGKERRAEWPFDVDGHLAYHRVKDIEEAVGRTR